MKCIPFLLVALVLATGIPPASAQVPDTSKAPPPVKLQTASSKVSQIMIPKDPLLAGYLSATTPGLGQLYCGRFWRAAAFLGSEGLCFGIAAGIYKKNNPEFTYTVFDSAGNPHKLIGKESNETAKDKMTNGERTTVGILTLAGVALHVWNVLDAYRLAKSHNKKMFISNRANEAGVRLGLEMKEAGPSLFLTRRF